MAQCDLTVDLEDAQSAYRPGDVIRGWVEVRCDAQVTCNALTAGLRWRTHSKSAPAVRVAVSETLFNGTWQNGSVTRYPFSLALPQGPFTYRGQILSVGWELFAQADLPQAADQITTQDLVLEPDPDMAADWQCTVGEPIHLPPELQPNPPAPPRTISKRQGLGCLLFALIPIVALLVVAAGKMFDYGQGEISENEALGWIMAAAVVLGLTGTVIFRVLRDLLAWGRIGEVAVVVEPRRVRAGQPVKIGVSCQPRKAVQLTGATVRLRAQETVSTGSTEQRRSWREVVFEQEAEIAPARSLAAGTAFQAETSLSVPAEAPPTFATWDNQLAWTATVRLEIEGWPDFVKEQSILIYP